MRVVRAALGGAVVAATLASAAPALADPSWQPSGALTYTWRGDQARGCAQVGVCGVQGVLIIRPQDSVEVITNVNRSASVLFDGVSTDVRVRRTDPGSEGNCVDVPAPGGGVDAINVSWSRSGMLRGSVSGGPSSGRCAGPLAAEFARVLLRGRHVGGRHPSFDLRGTVPFAAGPYSGTLVSTLRISPVSTADNPLFSGGSSSSGSGGGSGPPPHGHKIEQLALTYRLALAGGAYAYAFAGLGDPLCDPFDACGARGSISVSNAARARTLTLYAVRRAPRHVGRSEALSAFLRGRFTLEPSLGMLDPVEVTESVGRAGSPTCVDHRADTVSVTFGPVIPSARMPVLLALAALGGLGSGSADDLMRTHCPGPGAGDTLGATSVLAQSRVSRIELVAPSTPIVLSARGGFAGDGYSGTRAGRISATLTLSHIKVSTYIENQFGGSFFGARR